MSCNREEFWRCVVCGADADEGCSCDLRKINFGANLVGRCCCDWSVF